MEIKIDAKGKACPIPVIMAKKEADLGTDNFTVAVDNRTAVENLKRFGKNNNFITEVIDKDKGSYIISFVKASERIDENKIYHRESTAVQHKSQSWAVFIAREGVGEGDPELSTTLMKMYLYTLKEGNDIPEYILFMNSGVRIPTSKGQEVDHLKELADKGVEILVCGACLNFYGLENKLEVGIVSNMYDIVEAMGSVNKLVTL